MRASAAQTLALRALTWAAVEGDVLGKFLAVSGLELDDLRARAADPELLAAFLDFVLTEDRMVEALCSAEGLRVAQLHEARRALAGRGPD
jgi:hypothetical protein